MAIPARLLGQAATASISGAVTDSSGAAVPGASIEIRNTNTGAIPTVVTDGQGRYSVPDLGIGNYEVRASQTGFRTTIRSGLALSVGIAPIVDIQLPLGRRLKPSLCPRKQVETPNAAISSLVNQTQMRELPLNGRNFEQLILLARGVSTYPAGGSSALTSVANAYSIAGARPEGYANMLDGED